MVTQVALVTGASSGIGEATALELLGRGFTVYGAARRVDRMSGIAAKGVRPLAMDVTDDASMQSGIATILGEAGRLDVLVNNAGYGSFGALEDVPLSEARKQFDVNIFGLARLTQLALPQLRRQKSGTIVNISSIGGKFYEPLGAWYHATKFAVEGLSDSLRVELKPHGINVVIIEPGAIRTEWNTIARENVMKTSGDSAYRRQAEALVRVLTRADAEGVGAAPQVIAAAIGKAVTARRPRARYVAPASARAILFLRWVLSDRMMDAVILRIYGRG
ncbi:NAD(P)-dependent dehydrogenase (short-subunit alcohol dehydrogenase family) [Cryobacterium sp. MP_M5]|uniref:oxidoreductase n=1 Tax=unclassified Cryobacterium TaxID=2649013 RepID=UPI0018CA9BC3|nr:MULTISPECIES: oxidoreductase [unclassified Cryobacterium]MBG6056734.1 NAD(P)-dependent dehydrogenase (short-subunit alcohol dehydrogenase family) [Cryobacterium sp. MP_M3]MEC5176406.1 NAD(P)-dependent dehydrogenase (short-subunit alcohol dehydrogenase family) [Cryobacterium sp. MP_M5]